MKITIDDVTKTIEIEGEVNIADFLRFLEGMGVNRNDYKIVGTKTIIKTVTMPYIEPWDKKPTTPVNPWRTTPYIISSTSSTSVGIDPWKI